MLVSDVGAPPPIQIAHNTRHAALPIYLVNATCIWMNKGYRNHGQQAPEALEKLPEAKATSCASQARQPTNGRGKEAYHRRVAPAVSRDCSVCFVVPTPAVAFGGSTAGGGGRKRGEGSEGKENVNVGGWLGSGGGSRFVKGRTSATPELPY